MTGFEEQLAKEIKSSGTWGGNDVKGNFLMCQEYYDWIEFLQNKLGFEEVNELQKEFEGSFYNPNL